MRLNINFFYTRRTQISLSTTFPEGTSAHIKVPLNYQIPIPHQMINGMQTITQINFKRKHNNWSNIEGFANEPLGTGLFFFFSLFFHFTSLPSPFLPKLLHRLPLLWPTPLPLFLDKKIKNKLNHWIGLLVYPCIIFSCAGCRRHAWYRRIHSAPYSIYQPS